MNYFVFFQFLKKKLKFEKNIEYFVFLNFFPKIEAELVLKMFLIFARKWGSCSYKLCSYKKKRAFPRSKIKQRLWLLFMEIEHDKDVLRRAMTNPTDFVAIDNGYVVLQ